MVLSSVNAAVLSFVVVVLCHRHLLQINFKSLKISEEIQINLRKVWKLLNLHHVWVALLLFSTLVASSLFMSLY